MLDQLRAVHRGPILAVGVSLGGNALLRWGQEAGTTAQHRISAMAAISAPLDLAASGDAMRKGFNRISYNRMFLKSMKPKALLKLAQYPGLFDRDRLVAAQSLVEFDHVFTGPLHGFKGAADYYEKCSAKPHLHRIHIPCLVLNARNDPFVPAHALPRPDQVGEHVTLWQPEDGGHVGFPDGSFPGHVMALPRGLMGWLGGFV
jgi:predicted alpha/beta-fold hydrolase